MAKSSDKTPAKSEKPAVKAEEKKPYTIIDVNHPGTVAAEASGVPVIVTNRPVLKDPMVVENDENGNPVDKDKEEAAALAKSKRIKIQPLAGSDDDADKPAKKSESSDDTKKTIAEIAAEADAKAGEKSAADKKAEKTEAKPEKADEEKAEESPKADETKAEPAPAEEKPDVPELNPEDSEEAEQKDDPAAAEAARKAAEKQVALKKLAESGTYALPINAVEKRRVRRFALIAVVLLLVLGLAWTDLALDAQLIHINGVNPPTDFFPDR
jgi:hypothetical protein